MTAAASELPAGAGVVLRPARRQDAHEMARLANNRRVWINLLDVFPHPYRLEDAREFLDVLAGLPGPCTHFAIVADGAFAGMAGFDVLTDVHRASANVGYWLGEPFWGHGIATAAVRALSAYAFASFQLERLQAEVF